MSERGHFFAVDWRCVEAICNRLDNSNAAVAYLVLARFASGRNHSSTQAGVTALHSKLGLSRGRADAALRLLETAKFVSQAGRGGTRKLYSWGEVQSEALGLSAKQRSVLERVKSGKRPIISSLDLDYQTAYVLFKKGALKRIGNLQGKPKFWLPDPEYVFLPNALVDGFFEGDLPLERLRQVQNPLAISTLMQIYRHANLPEHAGIPLEMVRQNFNRFDAGRWGTFTIWAFVSDGFWFSKENFRAPYEFNHSTGLLRKHRGNFLETRASLMSANLVEYVNHLVESIEEGAQIMHPFDEHSGTEQERLISKAAAQAARRMISDTQVTRAMNHFGRMPDFCPVQSHINEVQLVGLCRPVYRPNTSRTRAWARNFLHRYAAQSDIFANLAKNTFRTTT